MSNERTSLHHSGTLWCRDVHGNGIPHRNGIPVGMRIKSIFQWEWFLWEWECQKTYCSKIPTAISFSADGSFKYQQMTKRQESNSMQMKALHSCWFRVPILHHFFTESVLIIVLILEMFAFICTKIPCLSEWEQTVMKARIVMGWE